MTLKTKIALINALITNCKVNGKPGPCAESKGKTADFPMSVKHGGEDHYPTGKTGHRFDTGEHVAEYEHPKTGARVWSTKKGKVHPE